MANPGKEKQICLVLMSFSQKYDDELYRYIIVPSIQAAGLSPARADELPSSSSVTQGARKAIQDAAIIIADVTGKNPNVYFELGLAYALGKPLLMLTQDTNDVPFEIAHYKVIEYHLDDQRSAASLQRKITDAIKVFVGEPINRNVQDKEPTKEDTITNESALQLTDILEKAEQARGRGELDKEAEILQDAISNLEKNGDISGTAIAYNRLGTIYQQLGNYQGAVSYLQRSLEYLQRVDDKEGMAVVYGNLANTYDSLGDAGQSLELYHRSLEITYEINDKHLRASLLHNLGNLLLRQGRYAEAESRYAQALEIFEALGDVRSTATTYLQLATIKFTIDDLDAAENYLSKVTEVFEQLGDSFGLARALHNLGVVEAKRGKLDDAEKQFKRSLELKFQTGDQPGIAATLTTLAEILIDKGDIQTGLEYYNQAIQIQQKTGDQYGLMVSLANVSNILEVLGAKDKAIEFLEAAIQIADDIKSSERSKFDKRLTQLRSGEFPSAASDQKVEAS